MNNDPAYVHTLPDGRMAITFQQVVEWPPAMRTWIKTSNYWRLSEPPLECYVSPMPAEQQDTE